MTPMREAPGLDRDRPPGGSGRPLPSSAHWRNVLLTSLVLALTTAATFATKLHLDEEVAYNAAKGNAQRLNAYLAGCAICWNRENAQREIASMIPPRAPPKPVDDDEGYSKARGNIAELQRYLSTCKICKHRAEATAAINDRAAKLAQESLAYQQARGNIDNLQRYLNSCQICAHRAEALSEIETLKKQQQLAASETIDYQAARGNLDRLRTYVNSCKVCAHKTDALGEIDTLQKQQQAARETTDYQTARGTLDGLRTYVNSCKLCAHKTDALVAIRELEAQANYFALEACNSSRYTVSLAVMGRRNSNSNQWTVQGWWVISSGACASLGKFVKGKIYSAAAVNLEPRGWFGTDSRQCVTSGVFDRAITADAYCNDGRMMGFRAQDVTSDQFKLQISGEPQWSEDAYFDFRVCNRSNRWAAVATMGRQTAGTNQWIVEGWWRIGPQQCGSIGRYVRGTFYAMAEEFNGSGRWTQNNKMLCVEHPGPFRRVAAPNHSCQPSDLVPFRSFEFTEQATETWNLDP